MTSINERTLQFSSSSLSHCHREPVSQLFQIICFFPCEQCRIKISIPFQWPFTSQIPNTCWDHSCKESIESIELHWGCLSASMRCQNEGFPEQDGQLLECRRGISETRKHNMALYQQMHLFPLPQLHSAWRTLSYVPAAYSHICHLCLFFFFT